MEKKRNMQLFMAGNKGNLVHVAISIYLGAPK